LANDVEISGTVEVHLRVASVTAEEYEAPDEVIWIVKLLNIEESNGDLILVGEMTKYVEAPSPASNYLVDLEFDTSVVIPAGNKIGLLISGSNYPRIELTESTVNGVYVGSMGSTLSLPLPPGSALDCGP
jgi:hypothetical protein